MGKEIKVMGKTVSVFVLLGLILVLGVSAALLTYYGQITTTAKVEQAILLDGLDINTGSLAASDTIDAIGGDTKCNMHLLTNKMSTSTNINFEVPTEAGVTTKIVGTSGDPLGCDMGITISNPYSLGTGDTYFCVCYGFDVAIAPNTYTLVTGITP